MGNGLFDDDCEHGLPIQGCALCIAPPPGVNRVVFVTAGGTHFHNNQYCTALHSGQDDARDRGDKIHDIRATSWGQVQLEKTRCRTCVPRF